MRLGWAAVLLIGMAARGGVAQAAATAGEGGRLVPPALPGSPAPALMPIPSSLTEGSGQMRLDGSFSVAFEGYKEARLDRAAERLKLRLAQETGVIFLPGTAGAHAVLTVRTAGAGKAVQELGEDESYKLDVAANGATLTAATPLGVLRGMQTFLQLVQPGPEGFVLHAVTIDDKPRFPWRGLMLDSSRHFQPMPKVLETLDAMEAVKLNVFHWHLSDDQGFRAESRKYPKLEEMGSDGRFYTQAEMREVVDYAHERGIRVVPEFDMPGHARSWFPGYPELAAGPGPYTIMHRYDVRQDKGPMSAEDLRNDPAMDPTKEGTYKFLDGFLAEMTALFPDHYFHMGGDEVDGKQWDANPQIQAFMKAHGMKDDPALQAYFTDKVRKLVTKHGKTPIGWDEVLQPDTPKEVVIQSWRGQRSLFQAASRGYRGILSAGYYIDLNQPAGQHYLVDPTVLPADAQNDPTAKGVDVPQQLTPEQEALILGGETTEWTEFITPEILNNRIWPRSAAIAERFWSPKGTRDVGSMYARLPWVAHELRMMGVENGGVDRDMLQRMAGTTAVERLAVLAEVVQPPLDYNRETVETYDETNPLNHLVDAVPAESETARHFAELAHKVATGAATPDEHAEVRAWLTLWAGNDAVLGPMLHGKALTAELVPLSRDVSRAATIGLMALDQIEGHGNAAALAATQGELTKMGGMVAVLRNMLATPVDELAGAASQR